MRLYESLHHDPSCWAGWTFIQDALSWLQLLQFLVVVVVAMCMSMQRYVWACQKSCAINAMNDKTWWTGFSSMVLFVLPSLGFLSSLTSLWHVHDAEQVYRKFNSCWHIQEHEVSAKLRVLSKAPAPCAAELIRDAGDAAGDAAAANQPPPPDKAPPFSAFKKIINKLTLCFFCREKPLRLLQEPLRLLRLVVG